MNIVVCIKQVPGTSQVEIDENTGVLKRENVQAKLNPYDLFALETAFRIREKTGGKVIAITMGPNFAYQALCEAIYMGADQGVLLSDRQFAGADVVATSYALSQGIRHIGEFDLILCGKQTTDGDTAQVGPEIAEFLDIPHSTNIYEVVEINQESIIVSAAMEHLVQLQKIALPALLVVDQDIVTPRLPSYRRKKQYSDPPVEVLSLTDLEDQNPDHYGLAGSPTQVEKIFSPEKNQGQRLIEGDADILLFELEAILKVQRLI